MNLEIQTPKPPAKSSPVPKSEQVVLDEIRILVVSEDESITQQLEIAFRNAGFTSEYAKSISAGCESAKSGRFQVVVSTPVLRDGSWRRLVDIAGYYDLPFVVVLVARTFNFNEWVEALQGGAIDVIDAVHDLPNAGEAVKRAWWEACSKSSGHSPEAAGSPKAA